jgi:rhamnosyl/mannosyltransferase
MSKAVIVATPDYLHTSPPLQLWREKCHVIPLGIDPKRFAQPTPQIRAEADRYWGNGFRVLTIGRLTYYKGHEVLIRAVAHCPAVKLIIVGTGERRDYLQALIKQLNLEQRISLAGFQAEQQRNALLATCDVFCLPSIERTEAFGMVLLESMCFGKPVVASGIPGSGVNWVVRQGGHGIIRANLSTQLIYC